MALVNCCHSAVFCSFQLSFQINSFILTYAHFSDWAANLATETYFSNLWTWLSMEMCWCFVLLNDNKRKPKICNFISVHPFLPWMIICSLICYLKALVCISVFWTVVKVIVTFVGIEELFCCLWFFASCSYSAYCTVNSSRLQEFFSRIFVTSIICIAYVLCAIWVSTGTDLLIASALIGVILMYDGLLIVFSKQPWGKPLSKLGKDCGVNVSVFRKKASKQI